MAQRVLIAGCGDLGQRLARRLADRGDTVFGLRRRAELLAPPLQPVAADLLAPELGRQLPPDIDQVVYTATPSRRDEAGYRDAYVHGLSALLQALDSRPRPPSRWLFVSSTAVYGDFGGAWVDESAPTEPADFNGRVLLEAEALLAPLADRGVVLRLSGIYGPGRTWLLRRLRSGEARCQAEPPHYSNRIHSEDAAAALAHLLVLPAPEALYLGSDEAPSAECELLGWLAEQLGLPAPLPEPATHRPNRRLDSRRLRATGFEFTYPDFRRGYSKLLSEAG